MIEPEYPSHVNIEIIDGFYFLHKLGPAMPQTFGRIAEFILRKLCNSTASEIHIIFDRYVIPSIKEIERFSRNETDIPYTIVGPSQSRPNDIYKALKNKKFKEALIEFLGQYWENSDLASIIDTKKIFLTVGIKCYSYSVDRNTVIKREEVVFECLHEEADTRIIYHISKCPNDSKIMIKSSDTDVLIILLGNIFKLLRFEIWLLSSTNKNGVDECVNCTKLANILGEKICNALPGFHAYTGCDYTCSFFKKGKAKPLNILMNSEKYQLMFSSLNNLSNIEDIEMMQVIQEFTCEMYGIKNCANVNLSRLFIFQNNFSALSTQEAFLNEIKHYDSSQMPPCWESLKQKILRTIYVNAMWQNAMKKLCTVMDYTDCGWIYDENNITITPNMYDGSPTPLQIEEILLTGSSNEFHTDDINEDGNNIEDYYIDYNRIIDNNDDRSNILDYSNNVDDIVDFIDDSYL